LSSIGRALERLAPLLGAIGTAGLAGSVRPRRKLRLSPERRAALKLQGQYMGYLRNLPAGPKARAKAVREAKGIRAAIAFAKKQATR
jgi:hypothetical protein